MSTRSVDELVKAMGMSGISKSQVSRLHPIEGDWPYLWIDATYAFACYPPRHAPARETRRQDSREELVP